MEQPKIDSDLFGLASFGDRAGLERACEAEGADLSALDCYGRTPLHWAARAGRDSCVAYLIEQELDLDTADAAGMTPLLHAAQNGKESTVNQILEAGADAKAADVNGNTAMHFAIVKGILGMVQALEAKGVSLTEQNKNGSTPCHIACQNGQLVIARYLIRKLGQEASATANEAGDIPLHTAAKCGFSAICSILIEAGADVAAANGAGQKPQDVAVGKAKKVFV